MRILIVDDSAVMRRIHRNTLLENGVDESSLLEAKDGEEALKVAVEDDITLFLVDWNMPKLNGVNFVKEVRKYKKYSEIPIIMITSEAAKYNVIEAIQAGVTNYVVKPIQGNVLWEKIRKYL